MWHKFLSIAGLCAGIFLFASCNSSKHSHSKNLAPGTWQATPIVIDGDSKDWPSPYPNYDSKGMIAYATSNDGQNLYITMETGDELTQVKILKQGMTVSIDTSGQKDPQLSINYPLENDNDEFDVSRGHGMKAGNAGSYENRKLQKNLEAGVQSANQFSLEGFASCNGGYIVTQTLPCGIKVRAKIDEYKELVWEAVVPFRMIYGKDSITAADAGRPISVCFTVKPFPVKKKDSGGENNTGAANGGGASMGNGMGNGMGGRGGGRSGKVAATDPMQYLYERTKTWKQFAVAYQR